MSPKPAFNRFRWIVRWLPRPARPPLLRLDGTLEGARAAAPRAVLLSRGLYRCRLIDLSAVPRAHRGAALQAQVRAWAPFDQSAYRVAWIGTRAVALAWDRDAVAALRVQAGVPADAVLWPELLWQQAATADTVRMLALADGLEAQSWRGGELQATRWWPDTPVDAHWRAWAGDATQAVDAALAMPAPQAPVWLARPWATLLRLEELTASWSRPQRLALGGLAALLLAWTGAVARHGVETWQGLQQAEADLRDRAAAAAPVRAAREQAEALAGDAASLAEALAGRPPLRVLADLSTQLSNQPIILREFNLAADRLAIALEPGPGASRAAIVRDLAIGGQFEDVAEVRDAGGRGWLRFEMRVRTPADAAALPASAASAAPAEGGG